MIRPFDWERHFPHETGRRLRAVEQDSQSSSAPPVPPRKIFRPIKAEKVVKSLGKMVRAQERTNRLTR